MTKSKFFQRIFTAFLSTIVFAVPVAAFNYIPPAQQMESTVYSSFTELFLMYAAYSLVIFLLGGVPFSIIVDKIINKKGLNSKYPVYVLIYTLGGIAMNIWFFLALFNPYGVVWDHSLTLLLMGIGASLIFLHMSYLTNKIIN
ncbi:hypothetical protein [Alkalicoccus halolimnae]|uniref:Uncharacterized protein n=1 Tax=Alkalicoccus halolimnae TaxID=1667239 RepID=A0A5C7FE18_9BACI|nr:hypothetical protein [Alkalicoccus halolimnae]TXF83332.1 hypothetical protein FTX54_13215 [Alkalicoccus halolimnae]